MLRLATTASVSLATLLLARSQAHAMSKPSAETFLQAAVTAISTDLYGGQPFVSAPGFPVLPQIIVDPSRAVNATQDVDQSLQVRLSVNQGLLDITNDNVVKLALCHELGHIFSGPILDRHNLSQSGPRVEIAADLGAAYLLNRTGVAWPDVIAAANRGTTDHIFDPGWSGDHPPGTDRATYIQSLATLMQAGYDFDAAAAAVLSATDHVQQPDTWRWASVYTQAAGGAAPQNNDYKSAVLGFSLQYLRGDDIVRFAEYGRRIDAIRNLSPSTLLSRAQLGQQESAIAQAALANLRIDVTKAPSALSGSVANLSVNELQRAIRPPVFDFILCHLIGHAIAAQAAAKLTTAPRTFVETYADSLAVRLLAAKGHSKSTLSEPEILDQIENVLATWEPTDAEHPAPSTRRKQIAMFISRLP